MLSLVTRDVLFDIMCVIRCRQPPRSALRSANRSKAATRVSFARPSRRDVTDAAHALTDDQLTMIDSIETMLAGEAEMADAQRQTLNMVRAVLLTKDATVQTEAPLPDDSAQTLKSRTLTIFTLASHLSAESLKLGVEPSSVFKTFASMNRRRMSSAVATDVEQPQPPPASFVKPVELLPDIREMSFIGAETPDLPEDMLRKVSMLDASDPKEVGLGVLSSVSTVVLVELMVYVHVHVHYYTYLHWCGCDHAYQSEGVCMGLDTDKRV